MYRTRKCKKTKYILYCHLNEILIDHSSDSVFWLNYTTKSRMNKKKNRSKYLRQIDMHDNTINRTFNKIWTRTWDTQGLREKYRK